MEELLASRPAWYLAGPLIGLIVVGLLAAINQRLGVLGGYAAIVERAGGRSLGWRGCFLLGIVGGGLLFSLLAGGWRSSAEYGWLSQAVEDDAALGALLLGAGLLIGAGARAAGGCTSGNGLSGCSFGSPASFVSTATFMAAAVATAFAGRLLLGGGS